MYLAYVSIHVCMGISLFILILDLSLLLYGFKKKRLCVLHFIQNPILNGNGHSAIFC